MMTIRILSSLASALALSVTPVAVLAQEDISEAESVDLAEDGDVATEDETFIFKTEEEEEIEALEREMNEAFAIFGEIYKAEPLTEEQEALLPLATRLANKIMPEGSLVQVTDQTFEPVMDLIAAESTSEARVRLAEVSGMEPEELDALEDAAAQDALDVFDPNYAARSEKVTKTIFSTVSRLLEAMEPAYREALSRALTLRFDEVEMGELQTFFATPLGEKFARESFLVHHDPQMLGVMEQMGPALSEILPGMMEEFESFEADFENVRKFSDLSEAERDRVAALLEKSITELDALEPQFDIEMLEEDSDEGVV